MTLKTLNKREIARILALAFIILMTVAVLAIMFLNRSKKEATNVNINPNVEGNPSPLNKTDSPATAKAQWEELLKRKQQGEFFELKPEEIERFYIQKKKEEEMREQEAQRLKQQEELMQKQEVRRKIWESIGQYPYRSINYHIQFGDIKEEKAKERLPFKAGCIFKGVVERGTVGFINSDLPIIIKVKDPSNCAGLPYGSTLMGTVKADYNLLRGVVNITKIITPDGEIYNQYSGIVLGPDGMYGIGLNVVRNDRKLALMGSIMSGIQAGLTVEKSSEVTYITEFGIIKDKKERDYKTEDRIRIGIGEFGKAMSEYLKKEMEMKSPIEVVIPEGFPVEVVLDVRAARS